MSEKHTPGPWINHGCYIYRVGTDGKRTGPAIANTRVVEFITPDEEQQNVRLIVAAPMLLEALDGLMELERRGRLMPIGREWDAARAAIAAATGENRHE